MVGVGVDDEFGDMVVTEDTGLPSWWTSVSGESSKPAGRPSRWFSAWSLPCSSVGAPLPWSLRVWSSALGRCLARRSAHRCLVRCASGRQRLVVALLVGRRTVDLVVGRRTVLVAARLVVFTALAEVGFGNTAAFAANGGFGPRSTPASASSQT